MDFMSLLDKYPEKKKRLLKLEKVHNIAEMKLDLQDHEGMKLIIKDLESMIKDINTKLLFEKELSESDRKALMTERSCWLWLVNIFPQSKKTINNIKEYVEKL